MVDNYIERAINVTDEEEIMKISPVLSQLIYDGYKNDLDVSMVYERLMENKETSDIHSHTLNFICFCMIRHWRLNNVKPL